MGSSTTNSRSPRSPVGADVDWKARLKELGVSRRRRQAASPAKPDPSRRETGSRGEDDAARHLAASGVALLARNVRYPDGELDLVGLDGATLVFVEVRTRRDDARGTPLESVTPRKRARLLRAARRWLSENPGPARSVRFDVVGIVRDPFRIEWLRGAFDATR